MPARPLASSAPFVRRVHLCLLWRRWLVVLAALLLGTAPARAGLVTGNWDPSFGSFLPGLGWQVRAEFLVPNGCSSQGDGNFLTSANPADPCFRGDISVLHVWLRLYDIGLADANDFFGVNAHSTYVDMQLPPSVGYGISEIRVNSGQVSGIVAGRADLLYGAGLVLTPVLLSTALCTDPPDCNTVISAIPTAQGNLFGLTFGLDGPVLKCHSCVSSTESGGPVDVISEASDLRQFLVSYDSNDTGTPRATDAEGHPLGAVLDAQGQFLGLGTGIGAFAVPEPPALLLGLTALACALRVRPRPRRSA